jgi:GT2 family glycosyltransferase
MMMSFFWQLKQRFFPQPIDWVSDKIPAAYLWEAQPATHFYGDTAVPLFAGQGLRFTLTAQSTEIKGICLRFGTYQRRNHNHLWLKTPVGTQRIEAKDLIDNQYHCIEFAQPVRSQPQQLIEFELISSDGGENNVVAVWCSQQLPAFVPMDLSQKLDFSHDAPKVSIVIPVFNKALYTYNCLLQLLACDRHIAQEIIVINNASSDETAQLLNQVSGIKVVNNDENQGFVGACRQGAALAQGEFILFLNNDTQVMPHWLQAMLTKMADMQVGATGSKLIYPDGRLQEAGGIIFRDGSGWNYGRLQDPTDPEFNQSRPVDYCSGASLMIRTDLWRAVGGFDERYAPAYYEDTDLCFAVRDAGFEVVYCHDSLVVHHEGITAGTDTQAGYKAYQTINHQKFLAKWAKVLPQQCPPPPEVTPQQAARRLC